VSVKVGSVRQPCIRHRGRTPTRLCVCWLDN